MHLSSLHGGELPTKMDDSGVPRPMGRVFEALVPLPEDQHELMRIGLVGKAKITTAPRTLGEPSCIGIYRGRLILSCSALCAATSCYRC